MLNSILTVHKGKYQSTVEVVNVVKYLVKPNETH
jgi:hypothetical protein